MILRWVDAFILSLTMVIALVFMRYVVISAKSQWKTPWLDAGIGLSTYFCGHALVRGTWWFYSVDSTTLEHVRVQHAAALLVGTILMAAGALCITRVFLTAAWGRWTWQIVGVVAAILSLLMISF